MRTAILVRLRVEGLHNWKEADGNVSFLSFMHRHTFFFELEKTVEHDNRAIEIIRFKRQVTKYLERMYYNGKIDCCNFGSRSCEMLAKELLETFNLDVCRCLEDGENGAVVYKH